MKKLLSALLLFLAAQSLNAQSPKQIEDSLNKYFNLNKSKLDPLEGFWDINSTLEYYFHDTLFDVERSRIPARIAITRKADIFNSFNLSDEYHNVEFNPTDVSGVYMHRIYFPQTEEYSATQVVIIKANELEYSYDYPDAFLRHKSGNTFRAGMRVVNILKWSKIL